MTIQLEDYMPFIDFKDFRYLLFPSLGKGPYIPDYKNILLLQEMKFIILYEPVYNNKTIISIKPREQLYVFDLLPDEYIGKEVTVKIKKHVIGTYKVINKNALAIVNFNHNLLFNKIDINKHNDYVWPKKDIEVLDSYLKRSKYNKLSIDELFNQSIDLLTMYYKVIVNNIKFNPIKLGNKVSAMNSYISIRDTLNKWFKDNNYPFVVSLPNVFIRGINTEYDYLIVNKDKKDEFIFNEEDVIALGEIKTSGYFCSKEDLYDNTEYSFINYLNRLKQIDKPLIYTCIYETDSETVHYYEYTLSNILDMKNMDIFGIYCLTRSDSDHFDIPYEYDLNNILLNIFKK